MNKAINKVIKKYIKLSVLSIIAVVLVMTGVTYALFQTEHVNTTNQAIAIGTLDVNLSSSSGYLKLYDLYPESSDNIIGTNNNKFTFTIENTGDYALSYNLYLTDDTVSFVTANPTDTTNNKDLTTYTNFQTLQSNSSINGYDYMMFSLDGGSPQTLSSVYNSSTGKFTIKSGTLNSGAEEDHYIQFWLDNGESTQGPPNEMQNSILVLSLNLDGSASAPYKAIRCIDSNGDDMTCPETLEVGQRIAIGDEVFRFIRYTSTSGSLNECGGETGDSTACADATNGDIRAIAEYNLYVGHIYNSSGTKTGDIATSDAKYGRQDSTARGLVSGADRIGTTEFSSASVKGTKYSSYTGSIVEDYVEEYVQYLSDEYGATVSGGLITKAELESLGCDGTNNYTCSSSTYPWVYTTSYWSGSPFFTNDVWGVNSNADFDNNYYLNGYNYGVRPVITISASDI